MIKLGDCFDIYFMCSDGDDGDWGDCGDCCDVDVQVIDDD